MNAMDPAEEDITIVGMEQGQLLSIEAITEFESEGELQYRDYIERQDLNGEFLDETIILGRLETTGECIIRVPGVGIFGFDATAVPTDFLVHIEHGIYGGYMAKMSNGYRMPVYHFSDNSTRITRFKYDGLKYADNIRTVFHIPSTSNFGTFESGIAEHLIADAENIPRSRSRPLMAPGK